MRYYQAFGKVFSLGCIYLLWTVWLAGILGESAGLVNLPKSGAPDGSLVPKQGLHGIWWRISGNAGGFVAGLLLGFTFQPGREAREDTARCYREAIANLPSEEAEGAGLCLPKRLRTEVNGREAQVSGQTWEVRAFTFPGRRGALVRYAATVV